MPRRITPNKPALSSAPIQAALRRVAERHGYTSTRGPRAGQGNAIEVILALDSGELATVLLPDEQRWWLIRWLHEQAQQFDEYSMERAALQALVAQLMDAVQHEDAGQGLD
jgi:hypothetical protein